jgi:hypothetical protein
LISKKELIGVVCGVCDFYKKTDEQLECGALKIIRILIEKGKLNMEDLSFAAEKISAIKK